LLTETNALLENKVFEQTREIRVTQKTSIEALAVLAEYYDHDTGAHLSRIQEYVVLLLSWLQEHSPYAAYIQGKKDYISSTAFASLLHDIGKVAIAKEILLKPGKLTREEFGAIQMHTQIAGQVLNRANQTFVEFFGKDSYLALARDIALFHHEKWNGEGYPSRLREEEIPLSARVVALADVYDALRSKRPYKEPKSHAWAKEEILKERGRHFDPWVVEAFLAQAAEFERISTALHESGAEGRLGTSAI
jgi:response regulator RpfG family c-di-GMP phosphodiesterase